MGQCFLGVTCVVQLMCVTLRPVPSLQPFKFQARSVLSQCLRPKSLFFKAGIIADLWRTSSILLCGLWNPCLSTSHLYHWSGSSVVPQTPAQSRCHLSPNLDYCWSHCFCLIQLHAACAGCSMYLPYSPLSGLVWGTQLKLQGAVMGMWPGLALDKEAVSPALEIGWIPWIPFTCYLPIPKLFKARWSPGLPLPFQDLVSAIWPELGQMNFPGFLLFLCALWKSFTACIDHIFEKDSQIITPVPQSTLSSISCQVHVSILVPLCPYLNSFPSS